MSATTPRRSVHSARRRCHVAGLRVLKLIPGIGPATARRALLAFERKGHDFSTLECFRPPAAAAEMMRGLAGVMKQLVKSSIWGGQIERLRVYPILDLLYDDPRPRRSDLDQLERVAAQHPSRSSFLTDLTLDPPEACGGEAGVPIKDEDWLVLSTIHSAKGQEWRAVVILNVVDGCIPSDLATGSPEEIDEERRLLYVAMTRASDDLELMQPLRFFMRGQARGGDAHVFAPRSRFIAACDLDAFELIGGHISCGAENGMTGRPVANIDQDARNMALMTLRNDPSAAN